MPGVADLAALVDRARAGDQTAWNRLVDAHAGLVWSVIRSCNFYGDDARDISQTVWLRCVEHLSRLRDPEQLAGWLATTARRECYRLSARRGRAIPTEHVEEAADESTDSTDLLARIVRDHDVAVVRSGLARISDRCRTLLVLLVTDPAIAYDDIAVTMEMPKGSIGPTRARCLGHLRAAIAAAGDVPA